MTDSTAQTCLKSRLNPPHRLMHRLEAADSAWRDFIVAVHASRFQVEPVVNQNLVFLLFAKFVLELVPDNYLRTQLFEYFELRFIPTTISRGLQDE
jgi:hypothetical protein